MRRLVLILLLMPALGSARADEVQVSTASCTALAGAAYVPGVDAAGQAVVPADLPRDGAAVSADTISIEIDPSLAGKFGVPAAGGSAYRGRAVLGYVTVTDGRAYFNGKPLAPDAVGAVAAACRAAPAARK